MNVAKGAKKCEVIYDWVEKVIYRELCKKLKLDHTTKWCVHKPEPVLENETHTFFRDFEIQADHLISLRRRQLGIIERKQKQKQKKRILTI